MNGFLNDNNATMFTTASVRNLTFDGTLDAVMEAANDPGLNNIGIPIPFDRFGWFYPVSTKKTGRLVRKIEIVLYMSKWMPSKSHENAFFRASAKKYSYVATYNVEILTKLC